MLTTGNIKFFCESCQNYIDKREVYFHANDCPGNKFKKMTFSTELDRNENSNYFKKNESKNDHYNMKDGLMTFGRTNQRLNDNIQVDNQFSSSKSQFNKDEFSDTFKRKDFKYDTLKNFNSNDNMDNFKQSGALKQIDQFSSSKQNFKDFHDPYSTTGTFLRKQNPFLQIQSSIKEYDENDKIIKDEKYSYINIRRNDIKDIIGAVGLSNSGIENNSFLNVVIQCLWNMKAFRNFLLSDFNISENDLKYKILSNLKNYSKSINIKGKIVEIEKLRQSLSEQFQSRRKFLPEHSDDPVDVLFVFLNCFHSFFIKSVANEISEESCNFECISHQLFWIDLYRLDECECGASSKKMFSYHNYMFDIPFDKIFECLEKLQTPELNKRIKLKSGKLNSDNNNNNNIADFKGKLFNCLKNQLSQIKINCPSGRCSNNETKKTYILSNLPTFFMINLQNKNIFNNSALDVLKSFLLIPGLFDISTIFEYSNQKKKIFYEFLGGIFSNNNHSFNAFFIQQNEWIHYCDEKISHYKNWYEFILEMIKKQEMPMFLIFQKQENYDEVNLNLLHDDILKLERYARNIDSIPQIMINKFRPYEDISKIDTISVFENMSPTQEHNKFKRVSKADQIESYNCSICNYKNKIDNIICVKCNKNNEIVINKLINNKKNENLPLSSDYTKPSINTIETSSKTNNFFNNPIKNSNFESYSKGFHNKNENDNNLYNNKNDIKEIIKANDTPQFPEEKNKNLNLPKQIHTKENNLKTKENNLQTTITKLSNCNECSKLTEKCICKKYKENFNNDNQTVIKIEDKNKKTNFNDWECENCRFINQISNTNCKLCKSSNKPSIQQSTTMNSRDIFPTPNNINSQNSKRSPEKTIPKNIELINNSVGGKNPQAFIKEINISQNKCICNVIDNDSLFTNNICRLCKKPRPEKNIKQQPKKIITNYTEDKNSKEIQQVSIVSNLTPSKTQMTKTNSKEKTNFTELKRLEVKKGQFDINDSRNSKNLNNQIKPNSNLKSNLNFKEMSSESNNPFKKTSYVNAQVANHGNNRNSKDVEIKQNNSNNNYNLKNTISKQKLNDNSHQKFK